MQTLEAKFGESIYGYAQRAIALAEKTSQDVQIQFNELDIIVSPYSHDVDIATIYSLKHRLRQLENK